MQIIQLKGVWNTRLMALFFSMMYIILIYLMMPLRFENLALVIVYNMLIWISPSTRKFILAFTVFVVFAILYDLMKVYPNYLVSPVDISPIYHLEKSLFGVSQHGIRVTPNQFFSFNHSDFLDLTSGIFYLNWIPVPLAFALYLFYSKRSQFIEYSLTFLLVNLIGFCFYYIHPTAPPWYVEIHGFNLNIDVHGNAAGFTRFDEMVNYPVFSSIYTRNSNVFAAVPSLHCAYPVIVLYYGFKNKLGAINWLLAVFMLGIWFSAVYSSHHYVIDVILGIICAMVGILVHEKLLLRWNRYVRFTGNYLKLIT